MGHCGRRQRPSRRTLSEQGAGDRTARAVTVGLAPHLRRVWHETQGARENMWVEAILAKDDLVKVTGELCPLRIDLGQDGHIVFSEPRELALVPDIGLRITVTVEVHWPVLGIEIPLSVRSATLDVKPVVLDTPDGSHLTFKLRLEDVDFSLLPDFVDRGIVDLVNEGLEAKHVELAWGYTRTLSHVFELPEALASVRALDLRASEGRVKITGEALALAVLFEARVERRPMGERSSPSASSGRATGPALVTPPGGPPPNLRQRLASASPASLAAVCGMAFLSGMGLVALLSGRRRRPKLLEVLRESAS
jgi:hypothetical protein